MELSVGAADGASDEKAVGALVGARLSSSIGGSVDALVGAAVGANDGNTDETLVGPAFDVRSPKRPILKWSWWQRRSRNSSIVWSRRRSE